MQRLIHESSSVSRFSELGTVVFINRNVSINSFSNIGNNVLLKTGCIIEHDCVIVDIVQIAPAALLAGNVQIGKQTFICSNSNI